MANADQRSEVDSENEVWQAISAFEQILEVMPDDRSSLETLSHAYEHVGDRARALDYLLRLAEVILSENDAESVAIILERLADYGETDEQVRSMMERLLALQPSAEDAIATDVSDAGEARKAKAAAPSVFRVTDELAMAWKLLEAGEISQEDYSALAQDLAELSTDPHLTTVSVFHVLENRAYSGMERVMGYVSRDTKTPLVSVQAYEVSSEMGGLLPVDFMVRHGVVIFGAILDELLVAIMNPYNQDLQEDIAARTERTCHFFMTPPNELDALITSLKEST